MKTKYRSIIYQNDQKNKPNLMGYFTGETKYFLKSHFFKIQTKIKMSFKTLWKIYSKNFGVSCYSLSTLLFKCSLSEKFLNKTQMPLWVKKIKWQLQNEIFLYFPLSFIEEIMRIIEWHEVWNISKFKYFQTDFFGKSFLFPLNKTSKV